MGNMKNGFDYCMNCGKEDGLVPNCYLSAVKCKYCGLSLPMDEYINICFNIWIGDKIESEEQCDCESIEKCRQYRTTKKCWIQFTQYGCLKLGEMIYNRNED